MEDQTKTFTKKTEIVFTTVEIEKTNIYSKVHVAKFKAGASKSQMKDVSIKGWSLKHCIDKVSKFLDCEINEKHYIIK